MKLVAVLNALGLHATDDHDLSTEIAAVYTDSRRVQSDSAFFALQGESQDGKQFISEAIEKGATLIVEESLDAGTSEPSLSNGICYLRSPLARSWLTTVGNLMLPYELESLRSIAVTGTNGKTTISWLLAETLFHLEQRVVQTGTCGFRFLAKDETRETFSPTTTPNMAELLEFLRQCSKPTSIVSEMSSHALMQQRLRGFPWEAAIFSNLSRDHLDYHSDMESYFSAKALLFNRELEESKKQNKFAIINQDDPYASRVLAWAKGSFETHSFSISSSDADSYVQNYRSSLRGIEADFMLCGKPVSLQSSLIGQYNLSNLLAVASTLACLGWSNDEIAPALSKAAGPPGRLEQVASGDFSVLVDYAHTPAALETVLNTLKPLTRGRLIVVFGCGGNRDRGKRYEMALAASKLASKTIVTSDNPRYEDPQQIISDILEGMSGTYAVEVDRRAALEKALHDAQAGDVILVAGKGHEEYQEKNGKRTDFSDKRICQSILKELRHEL